MPKIIDREQIKTDIVVAFQQCLNDKPIAKTTLRDIAAKAGMSHSKLLCYFKDKNEIVFTCAKNIRIYFTQRCVQWFATHNREDYSSNEEYFNCFLEILTGDLVDQNRLNATFQIFVLAHYDESIAQLVAEENLAWRKALYDCLSPMFKNRISDNEIEVLLVLIAGTYTGNYNKAFSGSVNSHILTCIGDMIRPLPPVGNSTSFVIT